MEATERLFHLSGTSIERNALTTFLTRKSRSRQTVYFNCFVPSAQLALLSGEQDVVRTAVSSGLVFTGSLSNIFLHHTLCPFPGLSLSDPVSSSLIVFFTLSGPGMLVVMVVMNFVLRRRLAALGVSFIDINKKMKKVVIAEDALHAQPADAQDAHTRESLIARTAPKNRKKIENFRETERRNRSPVGR